MSTSVIARMKRKDGSVGSPAPDDEMSGGRQVCGSSAQQIDDLPPSDLDDMPYVIPARAKTIERGPNVDTMDTTPDGGPGIPGADTGTGPQAMVISEEDSGPPVTPPRQFVMPQPPANRRAQKIRSQGREASPIPVSSDLEPDGRDDTPARHAVSTSSVGATGLGALEMSDADSDEDGLETAVFIMPRRSRSTPTSAPVRMAEHGMVLVGESNVGGVEGNPPGAKPPVPIEISSGDDTESEAGDGAVFVPARRASLGTSMRGSTSNRQRPNLPIPIEISSDDDTGSEPDDGPLNAPARQAVMALSALRSLEVTESPPYRGATPIDVSSTEDTDSDMEPRMRLTSPSAVPRTSPRSTKADGMEKKTRSPSALGSPISLERSLVEERRGLPATAHPQNWRGLPDIAKTWQRLPDIAKPFDEKKSEVSRPMSDARVGRPLSDARCRTPDVGRPLSDARCRTPAVGRPLSDARCRTPAVDGQLRAPPSLAEGFLVGFNRKKRIPVLGGDHGPSRPKSDDQPDGKGVVFPFGKDLKGRTPYAQGVPGPSGSVGPLVESQFDADSEMGASTGPSAALQMTPSAATNDDGPALTTTPPRSVPGSAVNMPEAVVDEPMGSPAQIEGQDWRPIPQTKGKGLLFRLNDESNGRKLFTPGVPGPWRSVVGPREEGQFEGNHTQGPHYDGPAPRMLQHDIQQGTVLRARLEALRELQRANRRSGAILAKMAKYYGPADEQALEIPGFQERLGLSYHNSRSLLQRVDSLPDRAEWMERCLSFKDRPNEKHLLQFRDIIQAIRTLLGNPEHADHIVYRPRRIFSDASRTHRLYNEMWTGRWWHAVQSLLPEGAAVAPVIIATDKTQLTQFSGNKAAYPVYMTLGNIPRALRRKPSEHACILIGYLSVDKVSSDGITQRKQRALVQQLFHASVRAILEPLVKAGKEGIDVTSGNGEVRRVHPILAAYVADYPEQCLVTCAKSGTCPKCQVPEDLLGSAQPGTPRTSLWTLDVLRKAEEKTQGNTSSNAYTRVCQDLNVSGYVVRPFWRDLPYTDIHSCITPDVLHQLYQGVFKHIVEWCTELVDELELDRRIRCLPPAFGTRHFKNGFSSLSQVSGTERKHMARILLACLVGKVPQQVILAFRSILDFIYLAQYTTHDDTTLQYMEDALKTFHRNKHVLVDLGVREHLNIPKFHSLLHYVDAIRLLGTTDNYNTEAFERLHIDYAKNGWRASNHRDARPQMVRWLVRQEKMVVLRSSIHRWLRSTGREQDKDVDERVAGEVDEHVAGEVDQPSCRNGRIKLPKHPTAPLQALPTIVDKHCAPGFIDALAQHIYKLKNNGRALTSSQLQNAVDRMPFNRVDVFHGFKFAPEPLTDDTQETDAVKAKPATARQAARFDTVVVLQGEDAEATGLQGLQSHLLTS
ncbi:uncharacterized protein B0H18DRAFT_1125649 [Fomitopsis serialis]|uniref:uncharacterized protein n=1 Tax=Fomitopsis serialis TaxID=139415 RepID=UPI0020079A27|nr:uncharacterized protein B0H18DRAFT_1125649 [Neoantrodia serialis]KAH9914312.1 hypothetical protein B0H18DRAFT_1125649 [Neoantrodia serialis]